MAQVVSCIREVNRPVYPGTSAVSIRFQGLDFPLESACIKDTAVRIFPRQPLRSEYLHADYNLKNSGDPG